MKRNRSRALIAPIEIAGFYTNLANELRALGLTVDIAFYYKDPHHYGEKGDSFLLVRAIRLLKSKAAGSARIAPRIAFSIIAELVSLFYLISTLRHYDYYIFGFGASLMTVTHVDLLVLKIFRKKVVSIVAHGSDSRPPYMNGRFSERQPEILAREAARLTWNLKWTEKFASVVIGSPYCTSIYANKPFLNFYDLGLPRPVAQREELAKPKTETLVLKVLHAPSSRATKGTNEIISVVRRVKNMGYPIELTILEGCKNEELLKQIPQFDLVVDQLYSDTPMAGLALECLQLGVPVLVGGYKLHELERFMPDKRLPPTIIVRPDDFEARLIQLLTSEGLLDKYREQASRYLSESANHPSVGEIFLTVLEGTHALSTVDPRDVRYFEGVGQPRVTTAKQILSIYRHGGLKAMGLQSKPLLAKDIIGWAEKAAKEFEP